MNIGKDYLKNIVESAVRESIFGLSGQQLGQWGVKNPIDDYPIDFSEVKEKTEQFLQQVNAFSEFIDGVEEDAENGVEEKIGLKNTLGSRAMWRNEEDYDDYWKQYDEKYYSEELRKVSKYLDSIKYTLNELVDYCDSNID